MVVKNCHSLSFQIGLLLLACCTLCVAYVVPVNHDLENGLGVHEIEDGMKLMQAMNIPDCSDVGNCSTWCFPTSIAVQGVCFTVKLSQYLGEFQLVSPHASNDVVLAGRVVRMNDSVACRRMCFARMASPSVGALAIAGCTSVVQPVSDTNVLYLARSNLSFQRECILGWKNVYVLITAASVTNIVDFAVSLVNAGLPEVERLLPLQQNP